MSKRLEVVAQQSFYVTREREEGIHELFGKRGKRETSAFGRVRNRCKTLEKENEMPRSHQNDTQRPERQVKF